MKKSRKIITFEPAKDVQEMLERAKAGGLTIGEVMNEAAREYGVQVISELAQAQIRRLKKLTKPSFKGPDCQPAGLEKIAA